MPERGLEPPPSYLDKNLNLARLPIPPLGRVRALIVPLVPRRASVHVAGLNSPAPASGSPYPSSDGRAGGNNPYSEPAVGMLDSGRLESTELVGFAQTPMVLKHSLRLRVPTDRLRRKFPAPTS